MAYVITVPKEISDLADNLIQFFVMNRTQTERFHIAALISGEIKNKFANMVAAATYDCADAYETGNITLYDVKKVRYNYHLKDDDDRQFSGEELPLLYIDRMIHGDAETAAMFVQLAARLATATIVQHLTLRFTRGIWYMALEKETIPGSDDTLAFEGKLSTFIPVLTAAYSAQSEQS